MRRLLLGDQIYFVIIIELSILVPQVKVITDITYQLK